MKKYSRANLLFQYPVDSRGFGIVEVKDSTLSRRSVLNLLDFETHGHKLPRRDGFVFTPFL